MRGLLVLINDIPYFMQHRVAVARAARDSGWQVEIAAPSHPRAAELQAEGFVHHPVELVRPRAAPASDLAYVRRVGRLIAERQPALVHAITIKPVLLGGLALKVRTAAGRRQVPLLATVPGRGTVFADRQATAAARMTRRAVEALYRGVIRYPPSFFTFETEADCAFFRAELGLPPDRAAVMPGAGLDLQAFRPSTRSDGPLRILFASRLLRSKGVDDFIAAARETASRRDIEWLIAGWPDPGNPESLTQPEVQALGDGPVRYLGAVEDMPALLAGVHAVALPTRYAEGVPRILIEAAACGAVPIASDFPGARAVIQNGETGLLLREPLAESLTAAAGRLADSPGLRARMGAAARRRVETGGFDQENVNRRFLEIFASLTEAEARGQARL